MEGLGWAQASGDVALEGLGTEAGHTASSACACKGPGMGAGDVASSACTCACGRLETSEGDVSSSAVCVRVAPSPVMAHTSSFACAHPPMCACTASSACVYVSIWRAGNGRRRCGVVLPVCVWSLWCCPPVLSREETFCRCRRSVTLSTTLAAHSSMTCRGARHGS
jgi:hypothetical protein